MKNKVTIFFMLYLLVGTVGGCQSIRSKPSATPNVPASQQVRDLTEVTPTLPDPHNHIVDITNNSLGEENAEEFRMIEVTVGSASKQENEVVNPDGTFLAFSTCTETCRIFVNEVETDQTYELSASSFLPTRPFSELVWIATHILIFDQWSQPHHGIHYAIDVSKQELVLASPFTDQIPPLDPAEQQ